MKAIRLSWALLLIGSILAPDMALAARTCLSGRQAWNAQYACGMAVCCCPRTCKMAKKTMPACRHADRNSCGIKSGSSKNNVLASGNFSFPKFRIAAFFAIQPKTTQTFRLSAAHVLLPDAHAPALLKPPTSLS